MTSGLQSVSHNATFGQVKIPGVSNFRMRRDTAGTGSVNAGRQGRIYFDYRRSRALTAWLPSTRADGSSVSHNGRKDAMQVNLEIPEDLGRRITADPGELPRAALEGLALEAIAPGSSRCHRRAA